MTRATATAPEEPVVAGNVYPKYETRNPLARYLVGGFVAALRGLVRESGATNVHEVGCGEGFLSTMLAEQGCRVRASDLSPVTIAMARDRGDALGLPVDFAVADIYELRPERDAAELIVCCEVLEHLPDPERALAILSGLARPFLIVSVPREPLWRVLNVARGRYLSEFGNTPGHLQHWSRRAFLEILGRHVDVVRVRSPLPWTMALCRTRP